MSNFRKTVFLFCSLALGCNSNSSQPQMELPQDAVSSVPFIPEFGVPLPPPIPPEEAPRDVHADTARLVLQNGGQLSVIVDKIVNNERQQYEIVLNRLADLPQQEFKISGVTLPEIASNDRCLTSLTGFSSIRQIHMSGYDVKYTPDGIAALNSLSSLNSLWLNGSPLTDEGLERLTNLRSLSVLVLWGTKITDRGLALLNQFPSVVELQLGNDPDYDGTGLSKLKPMPSVKELNFPYSNFGDPALEFLDRFPNVERLNLTKTLITNQELSRLKQFKSLKRLDLSETAVTDAGIKELIGIPVLHDLLLNMTGTTDEGLAKLSRCQTLRKLEVKQTKVTAEGVRRFRDMQPNCQIDSDFPQ